MRRVGLAVILAPFGDGYFLNLDRRFRTGRNASRRHAVPEPDIAHIAFSYNIAFGIKLRDAIRTVPRAILATDALLSFMLHNTRLLVFLIRIGGTAGETRRIQAVVAGHRKMKTFRLRINSAFNLSHTAPQDARRIIVLFIAGDHTALTAHATRHVKMKTVLLTGFESFRRD